MRRALQDQFRLPFYDCLDFGAFVVSLYGLSFIVYSFRELLFCVAFVWVIPLQHLHPAPPSNNCTLVSLSYLLMNAQMWTKNQNIFSFSFKLQLPEPSNHLYSLPRTVKKLDLQSPAVFSPSVLPLRIHVCRNSTNFVFAEAVCCLLCCRIFFSLRLRVKRVTREFRQMPFRFQVMSTVITGQKCQGDVGLSYQGRSHLRRDQSVSHSVSHSFNFFPFLGKSKVAPMGSLLSFLFTQQPTEVGQTQGMSGPGHFVGFINWWRYQSGSILPTTTSHWTWASKLQLK